jgi:hypothetical protein
MGLLTLPIIARRRLKFCRLFDAFQQVGLVRRQVCASAQMDETYVLRGMKFIEFKDAASWLSYATYTFKVVCMMMMSFICSCRNKNQSKAIYPKGTFLSHTIPFPCVH